MPRTPFHMDLKFKCVSPFQHDIGWYNEGDWFPKDVNGDYDVGAKRRIPERLFRQLHDQNRIESVEPETPGWDSIGTPDGEGGVLDPTAVAQIALHTAGEALVATPVAPEPATAVDEAPSATQEAPAVEEPQAAPDAVAVSITYKGFGKWSTLDVNGAEITKGLSKADAEALNLPKV